MVAITRDGDILVDENSARTLAPAGDGPRREQLRTAAAHLTAVVAFLDAEEADTEEARRDEMAKQLAEQGIEGLSEEQLKAVLAAAADASKAKPKGA